MTNIKNKTEKKFSNPREGKPKMPTPNNDFAAAAEDQRMKEQIKKIMEVTGLTEEQVKQQIALAQAKQQAQAKDPLFSTVQNLVADVQELGVVYDALAAPRHARNKQIQQRNATLGPAAQEPFELPGEAEVKALKDLIDGESKLVGAMATLKQEQREEAAFAAQARKATPPKKPNLPFGFGTAHMKKAI